MQIELFRRDAAKPWGVRFDGFASFDPTAMSVEPDGTMSLTFRNGMSLTLRPDGGFSAAGAGAPAAGTDGRWIVAHHDGSTDALVYFRQQGTGWAWTADAGEATVFRDRRSADAIATLTWGLVQPATVEG